MTRPAPVSGSELQARASRWGRVRCWIRGRHLITTHPAAGRYCTSCLRRWL